jgi:hypothetical protein
MPVSLLVKALLAQIQGSSAYVYGNAGQPYEKFNLEQQAMIVQDWWAGNTHPYCNQTGVKKDVKSPYYGYIIDNILTGQY